MPERSERNGYKYERSADKGIVRDIIFRGSSIEVKVEIHGNLLSAIRSINDPPMEIGEEVWVFVYRMLVVTEDHVQLLQNASLKENSIVI